MCCLCYRLQGAHKIVIYDDASEDNSLLLQDAYHQHGRHYLKMYPISVVDANFQMLLNMLSGSRNRQEPLSSACCMRRMKRSGFS